jgi:putative flippase GtrA
VANCAESHRPTPARSGLPLPAFVRRLSGVAGAGLTGWLVDVGLLWVGHEIAGLPAALAAAIGFLAGGLVNFLLNRIVFAGSRSRTVAQAWRYAALFAVNLALVSLSVPVLAAVIDSVAPAVPASLVAAKVTVTALLLPLNAVAYGAWVFAPRNERAPESGDPWVRT